MKKRVLLSLVLIIVFLAGSAGIAIVLVEMKVQPQRVHRPEEPIRVQTIVVKPETVGETIRGFGTARADLNARLSAQVIGEIVEFGVDLKVGVAVQKDQVLIRIDPDEYQHRLESAQASLQATEEQLRRLDIEEKNFKGLKEISENEYKIALAEYERVTGLYEREMATKRERDLAMLAQEARRRTLLELNNKLDLIPSQRLELKAVSSNRTAELELAQLNLERCEVKAPFDGVIEQVMIERGEHVGVGVPLLSLLDPRTIEVPIEMPIAARSKVDVGAGCRLTVASMGDIEWKGKVVRIAPSAVVETRTFEAYVEVDNTKQALKLLPGVFVEAEIDGPMHENVFVLPPSVIRKGRVYVCEQGKAKPRTVEITHRLRDDAIVTGVDAGDVVVISNLDMLHEDLPLTLGSGDDSNGGVGRQTGDEAVVQSADPSRKDLPPSEMP